MIFITESTKKAMNISSGIKVLIYIPIGYELLKPQTLFEWFQLVAGSCAVEFIFIALPAFIGLFIPGKDFKGEIAEIRQRLDDEMKEYLR